MITKDYSISLFKRFTNILFQNKLNFEILKEHYAYDLMAKYMPLRYFPITSSTLKFESMLTILNDITINNRKNYIEFGSGLSTLVVAKHAILNKIDLQITSIEHDNQWIEIMEYYFKQEGITNVTLLSIPLSTSIISQNNLPWYDFKLLDSHCYNHTFDIALVDGPPAYKKDNMLSRYQAIPFLKNKLNETYSIFLDDCNRPGEKKIIKQWEKEYKISFVAISETFAYSAKGDNFNILNI